MNGSTDGRSLRRRWRDFEFFFVSVENRSARVERAHGLPTARRRPTLQIGERRGGRMRRHHDMGGLPAGPVERSEHEHAPWEKKVDAILRLLVAKKIMTLDELRRGIEELGPGAYDELSYFERWIRSIANVLLEKGVIGVHELGLAIEAAKERRAAAEACPKTVPAP
jgi:hypothetical protein